LESSSRLRAQPTQLPCARGSVEFDLDVVRQGSD
jgi:hypothetical protein